MVTPMEIEDQENLICGICEAEFLTNSKLENHIKSEHIVEDGLIQCNECKVKKQSYKSLVKHKKSKHNLKKSGKTKTVNKIKIEGEENCKLCNLQIERCKIYLHYKGFFSKLLSKIEFLYI